MKVTSIIKGRFKGGNMKKARTISLKETMLGKGQIIESDGSKLPSGVLCRVRYPICIVDEKNRNNRIYRKEVWESVLKNEEVLEKLEHRNLFGNQEHPIESQLKLNKDDTSHIISEMHVGENNMVYADFDVLPTEAGKFINVLLEAGCDVGVSTRAEGELEEKIEEATGDKYYDVVPEAYQFITVDFTADPSTVGTFPKDIQRNVMNHVKSSYESHRINKNVACALLEGIKTKEAKKLMESIKKDKNVEEDVVAKPKVADAAKGDAVGKTTVLDKGAKDDKEPKIKPTDNSKDHEKALEPDVKQDKTDDQAKAKVSVEGEPQNKTTVLPTDDAQIDNSKEIKDNKVKENDEMDYTEVEQKEYFDYLAELRDSGITNMFGAAPYLQKAFGLEKDEARKILSAWMKSFNESKIKECADAQNIEATNKFGKDYGKLSKAEKEEVDANIATMARESKIKTLKENKKINEGMFSWLKPDGEPIYSSEGHLETVYMVDDDNKKYKEDAYEGYGVFGGKDYYALLAEMNGVTEGDDKAKRQQGIDIAFGKGTKYEDDRGEHTPGVKYPRFTTDENAKYSSLPNPKSDPNQGWFQEPEEDEDERYWDDDDMDEAKKTKSQLRTKIKDLRKEIVAFRKAGDKDRVKDLEGEIDDIETKIANLKESRAKFPIKENFDEMVEYFKVAFANMKPEAKRKARASLSEATLPISIRKRTTEQRVKIAMLEAKLGRMVEIYSGIKEKYTKDVMDYTSSLTEAEKSKLSLAERAIVEAKKNFEAIIKGKLAKLKEELKANYVKELSEAKAKAEKDLKEAVEKSKKNLKEMVEKNEKDLKSLKESHTKALLKKYFDTKVAVTGLSAHLSKRAPTLLEHCVSEEDVDNVINRLRDDIRENVSSPVISEVEVASAQSPAEKQLTNRIGKIMEKVNP